MVIGELKKNVGVEGIEIAGICKKIYPIKKGEGQFGPYSFQNMIIEDQTDNIAVSIRNHDEIKDDMEELPVLFQPNIDKDGKKVGVKVIEEKYKDKNGKEVKAIKVAVTNQAKIIWGGEPKKDEHTPIKDLLDEKSLSMFKSYAKDLVVAGMNNGLYKDEVAAGAGFIHWLNLLTNKEEKKEEVADASNVAPF